MAVINKLTKRQSLIGFGLSAFYLLMIIFLGVFVWRRGVANIAPVYLINISVDMVGIAIGYVICICCFFDLQKTGSDNRSFLYLLNTIVLGLLTDGIAWLTDGVPEFRWFNILVNTVYYIVTPVAAYFYFRYVLSFLNLGQVKVARFRLFRLIQVALGIYIAVCVLNIPFGFFFTVDEAGVYARSDYSSLSMVYPFLILGLTLLLIFLEQKQLQTYRVVVLLLYVFIPLAVGIFNIFIYGLSLNYIVLMLVMLLMYCIINIEQGRQKATADRDLDTASSIQENMLPSIFPAFPDREDVDIYALMRPAKEVGGDFYDFFFIDENHLALVMADVSGKGVPAALFMTITKVLIKNRLLGGDSPAEALNNVNLQVCESNVARMFVTVWLAVIDTETGEGMAANAGHEHPVKMNADGTFELVKYPHSPAVGMLKKARFNEHPFSMQPGEGIFVYTDGVAEAAALDGELFGTDRMMSALNETPDKDPRGAIERTLSALDEYTRGADQSDDITMLCMVYRS